MTRQQRIPITAWVALVPFILSTPAWAQPRSRDTLRTEQPQSADEAAAAETPRSGVEEQRQPPSVLAQLAASFTPSAPALQSPVPSLSTGLEEAVQRAWETYQAAVATDVTALAAFRQDPRSMQDTTQLEANRHVWFRADQAIYEAMSALARALLAQHHGVDPAMAAWRALGRRAGLVFTPRQETEFLATLRTTRTPTMSASTYDAGLEEPSQVEMITAATPVEALFHAAAVEDPNGTQYGIEHVDLQAGQVILQQWGEPEWNTPPSRLGPPVRKAIVGLQGWSMARPEKSRQHWLKTVATDLEQFQRFFASVIQGVQPLQTLVATTGASTRDGSSSNLELSALAEQWRPYADMAWAHAVPPTSFAATPPPVLPDGLAPEQVEGFARWTARIASQLTWAAQATGLEEPPRAALTITPETELMPGMKVYRPAEPDLEPSTSVITRINGLQVVLQRVEVTGAFATIRSHLPRRQLDGVRYTPINVTMIPPDAPQPTKWGTAFPQWPVPPEAVVVIGRTPFYATAATRQKLTGLLTTAGFSPEMIQDLPADLGTVLAYSLVAYDKDHDPRVAAATFGERVARWDVATRAFEAPNDFVQWLLAQWKFPVKRVLEIRPLPDGAVAIFV